MKRSSFYALPVLIVLLSLAALCQQAPSADQKYIAMTDASAGQVTIMQSQPTQTAVTEAQTADHIVLSGVASTARIADPNERVVFNGRVMRMQDFVAAASASSVTEPRLHSPEKHNREKAQPVPQSPPSDSN